MDGDSVSSLISIYGCGLAIQKFRNRCVLGGCHDDIRCR